MSTTFVDVDSWLVGSDIRAIATEILLRKEGARSPIPIQDFQGLSPTEISVRKDSELVSWFRPVVLDPGVVFFS